MYLAVVLSKFGTLNKAILDNSSGSEANSRYGLNFPQRDLVMSTKRPAARSANASQTRTTRNIVAMAAGFSPTTFV
jgi:hypothetical protein